MKSPSMIKILDLINTLGDSKRVWKEKGLQIKVPFLCRTFSCSCLTNLCIGSITDCEASKFYFKLGKPFRPSRCFLDFKNFFLKLQNFFQSSEDQSGDTRFFLGCKNYFGDFQNFLLSFEDHLGAFKI